MTAQTAANSDTERYIARLNAEKAALRRHYCNTFKFWRICPVRHCRKARACRGDAAFCLKRRLPEISREVRWQARQVVLAATPRHAGPGERMAREFLPEALI